MLKHIIVLLVLTIAVVFGTPQIKPLIMSLVSAHDWISQLLLQVFSGGEAGNIVRGIIALLVMPTLVGLVIALGYWLARRRFMPCFMETVWVVWLVQTTAIVVLYKAVGA